MCGYRDIGGFNAPQATHYMRQWFVGKVVSIHIVPGFICDRWKHNDYFLPSILKYGKADDYLQGSYAGATSPDLGCDSDLLLGAALAENTSGLLTPEK